MANIVNERVLDNCIVTDASGRVLWNAAQQDHPVIRRKYDDGTVDVIAQRDGRLILPAYNPNDADIPLCQHCGERPW